MSFNQAFSRPSEPIKPEVNKSSISGLQSLTSSQPLVGVTNSTMSFTAPTHVSSKAEVINSLKSLDYTIQSSPPKKSPSKSHIPTLDSLINNSDNEASTESSKKARELISAMTYSGEGALLDEGSDSDSNPSEGEDDDDEDSGAEPEVIQEKSTLITESEFPERPEASGSDHQTGISQDEELDKTLNMKLATSLDKDEQFEHQQQQMEDEIDQSVVDATLEAKDQKSSSKPSSSSNVKEKVLARDSTKISKKQVVFDFQRFLVLFKNKQCEPIHRYLKSFLLQFGQKSWTVDEQIKLVKDFQIFIFDKLVQCPPFNAIDDELELDNCKEGLEKLVMTRIYSQVFSPVIAPRTKMSEQHKEDLMNDKKYHTNVKLFDWVSLKHLDIPLSLTVESNFIKLASTELNKMNNYKSPRDKIICILNCCKIIFGLIRQQQKSFKFEENADSFVPLLIYVLLQAKPKYLYSNLLYIERFRNEEFLVGETSYYVSTVQIACNFIIDISLEKLTVSKEEYESEVIKAQESLRKEQEEKKLTKNKPQSNVQTKPDIGAQIQERLNVLSPIPKKVTDLIGSGSPESPSQVLTKSAELMRQSLSNSLSNFFQPSSSSSSSPTSSEATADPNTLLENIKSLSVTEHEREIAIQKQREDNFEVLTKMFPNLDSDLIRDVVVMKSSEGEGDTAERSIGACVDALLTLSE